MRSVRVVPQYIIVYISTTVKGPTLRDGGPRKTDGCRAVHARLPASPHPHSTTYRRARAAPGLVRAVRAWAETEGGATGVQICAAEIAGGAGQAAGSLTECHRQAPTPMPRPTEGHKHLRD